MNNNPVAWFEIYVNDMARAKAFYQAVLAVELSPLENPDPAAFADMEMWAFPATMDNYGAAGALVKMAGYQAGAGGTLVYFSCADCAIEAARAEANGGKLVNAKMAIGEHGFIALVADSEGNVIGLHSMQ